jgi:hypothetical protein
MVYEAQLPLADDGVVLARPQAMARPAVHESDGVDVVVEMPREDMAAAGHPAHFEAGQAADEFDGGGVHDQDA